MKQISLFVFTGTIILMLVSCYKPGLDGKATLVVYPQYNGKAVKSQTNYPDTIYVKFNAKTIPGLTASAYDTYFVGTVGEDHVNCSGLRAGQYFLFGVGFESTGSFRVGGGMAYKIKHKERKDQINVDLAVTQ